jgi:SAM-dependent methyltransferase
VIQTPAHARHAPATLRNRAAILDVLKTALPPRGLILEIASGTGEHIVHFAKAVPGLRWQPSDPDAAARASISAWAATEDAVNVLDPIDLDVRMRPWQVSGISAILCINMVHISPWQATEALLFEAGRLLPPGGLLYLYGPYHQAGIPTVPSNVAFDADLRQRNPQWGVRDLEAVEEIAGASGLMLADVIPMPANNLSVLFRQRQHIDD